MSLISYDNSAILSSGGSYTVGAGSNPYLLVMTTGYDGGTGPVSVTFGGALMTKVVSLNTTTSGASYPGLWIWGLSNPVQGTSQAINVTNGSGGSGSVFCAASYMEAGSVYPVYQSTNGLGNGGIVQTSITPTNGSWVISCGGAMSAISPTTTRQTNTSDIVYSDSNGPQSSLYTTTYTTVNLQYYQYASFLLQPYAYIPTPHPGFMSFM